MKVPDSHRDSIDDLTRLTRFFFFYHNAPLRDHAYETRAGMGNAGSETKRFVLVLVDNAPWSTYIFWEWGSVELWWWRWRTDMVVKAETVNFLDKLFQLQHGPRVEIMFSPQQNGCSSSLRVTSFVHHLRGPREEEKDFSYFNHFYR